MSRLMSVVLVLTGLYAIYYGLADGGDLSVFVNLPSIAIVVGGSCAAVIINYSAGRLAWAVIHGIRISRVKLPSPTELTGKLFEMAVTARRSGRLKLEDDIPNHDPFLAKAVQMLVDNVDRATMLKMLRTELDLSSERSMDSQAIFRSWGSYAPAFGMAGTLIGLINMLNQLNSPDTIGPAMAVALVTTLYGALLANLVFLPLAGKIGEISSKDLLHKQMVIEGITDIQRGTNPRVIEEKLLIFAGKESREDEEADSEENEEVVANA